MPSEVETARAGQWPSESACYVDRRGFPEPSVRLIGRIRRAARTIPIIAVGAFVLATLCLIEILAGSAVHATALAALGLAALVAVGFAGLRAHTGLAARLDILAAALDAVPEAQLVVAADGRAVFANIASYRFFPDRGDATLDHFERILAADPQAVTCDGDAGGFRWSAARARRTIGISLVEPPRRERLQPS